ncbi:metal transporter CNNM4 isoform X2 [Thrips palmi]|uniref:Metal transporter CNNM4 isoform X2 n=1 Tax=Thrips palmi TaxID=161013 RepID=A0A6P8YYF4_THRPL|nr:metal transporter CNNM4 isoform X2 [Thrips palmi]
MQSPLRAALGAAAVVTVCAALALALPAGSGAAVGAGAAGAKVLTATLINATRTSDETVFLRHGKLDGLVRDVVLAELRVAAPDTVQDNEVRFLLTADPALCLGGVLDDVLDDGEPPPDPGAGPGANVVAQAASVLAGAAGTTGVDSVSAPTRTRTVRRWFTVTHNLNARRLYVCVGSDSARTPPRTWTSAEPASTDSGRTSGQRIVWIHQGDQVVLELPAPVGDAVQKSEAHTAAGAPAQAAQATVLPTRRRRAWTVSEAVPAPTLLGFRVERSSHGVHTADDGVPEVLVASEITLRLFGERFSNEAELGVTYTASDVGEDCKDFYPGSKYFKLFDVNPSRTSALVTVKMPPAALALPGKPQFLCLRASNASAQWSHQGSETYMTFRSYERLLPVWLSIVIILTCLGFSALFSGLNLGLMSLDRTDLKIVCNTGTERERQYARAILPVRNHGNFLLCSILLGNVAVNSTLTILMDDLTSGLVAVISSTLAIVVFGEITPQAVCSRHGLEVGAKTINITKLFMGLTSPLSFPISKILDWILGEEIGNVYTRERIKELVKVTTEFNDLEKDEVNIIAGALELRKKTVADVMTKLEDVYMLPHDAILDFETVSEIMKSGFSRVPVYEGVRTNIVTMLYIKDLAFVDPDDETPLKTLCQFYQNECNFVYEDLTLDVLFRQFKDGIKGHMALVHKVNSEGEGDPFYETVGLITLEDVIEELIQAEIMDETDVFTDNKSKKRRKQNLKQDFTAFCERRENQHIHISPQLTLATFQYLSASVEAFKPHNVSETILRRLLRHDVIFHIKVKNKEKARQDPATCIYQQGKPSDYFVLILEGRVEVTVGKENLMFESGPFTYFGTQALMQSVNVAESPSIPTNMGSLQSVNLDVMLRHTFVPDYTVRAVMDVLYIRVRRSAYLAAKQATLMAISRKDSTDEHFDDEVEKLLHAMDDDEARSRGELESQTHSPTDRSSLHKHNNVSSSAPVNKETSPNGSIHSPLSPGKQETALSRSNSQSKSVLSGDKKSTVEDNADELKSLLPQDQEPC